MYSYLIQIHRYNNMKCLAIVVFFRRWMYPYAHHCYGMSDTRRLYRIRLFLHRNPLLQCSTVWSVGYIDAYLRALNWIGVNFTKLLILQTHNLAYKGVIYCYRYYRHPKRNTVYFVFFFYFLVVLSSYAYMYVWHELLLEYAVWVKWRPKQKKIYTFLVLSRLICIV